MYLTNIQTIIIIAAVAFGTAITRFTPFLLFPENKKPPEVIVYLGRILPPSVMAMLIVDCLKNTQLNVSPYGMPELISIAVIIAIHKWKHNTILTLVIGTALYMFLVQKIFI